IRKSGLIRDRFGTILANIGADAWTVMLDTVQRLPNSSYTQAAYFIMPQFVNRLPWETFMEAALNHPVEAIRSQATICVQKYDVPKNILQKLADKTDHMLLQGEQRYPDLLQTAVRAVRQLGQPGTDALFACWHSSDTDLKQAAIAEMRFVTDASLFDQFVEAIKSADTAIHRGGIIGLFDLAEYLSPQQQSLAVDTLIPILNTETFDNAFTAIEVLTKCKDARATPAIQAVQRRHIRHSYQNKTHPRAISPIQAVSAPLQYKTNEIDTLFRKRLKTIIHSLSEKNHPV
ncbi:MAG TPA: hypothetical protein VHO69_01965, partial [Phototrophicaceae bacterium]|nr:hypothetical protein [Phototrophicaceae bacterium]